MNIVKLGIVLLLLTSFNTIAGEPKFLNSDQQEKWCGSLFAEWQKQQQSLKNLEKEVLTSNNARKYVEIMGTEDENFKLLTKYCFYGS